LGCLLLGEASWEKRFAYSSRVTSSSLYVGLGTWPVLCLYHPWSFPYASFTLSSTKQASISSAILSLLLCRSFFKLCLSCLPISFAWVVLPFFLALAFWLISFHVASEIHEFFLPSSFSFCGSLGTVSASLHSILSALLCCSGGVMIGNLARRLTYALCSFSGRSCRVVLRSL
jgi:hypothetical protein